MMNSFSALHKYDLEIRFNRRDLYQTSAFCGHVFTMKLLLKKITLGHMTENICGYQMHIFVTSFSKPHAPVRRCFCMVQPLRQPFRPKCTNRILQMHHQNPVVPSESGVHPQNPAVCTYSVYIRGVKIYRFRFLYAVRETLSTRSCFCTHVATQETIFSEVIGRTYSRGYLDHAFKPHSTISPTVGRRHTSLDSVATSNAS